ncbi:hypothetical protein SDC9_181302 [bioreactor metagenome]|uniref:Secretion system C-terminal sorting domain-containing protein n=1 Tax=bioreactor metagenome TaxID=1076179 RepID=A0A645H545_9ZZZZ
MNNPVERKALVYPQPAKDKFIVDLPNLDMSKAYVMSVFDISGKVVRKETINQATTVFERMLMPSGIYYIQIISPQAEYHFKSKLVLY